MPPSPCRRCRRQRWHPCQRHNWHVAQPSNHQARGGRATQPNPSDRIKLAVLIDLRPLVLSTSMSVSSQGHFPEPSLTSTCIGRSRAIAVHQYAQGPRVGSCQQRIDTLFTPGGTRHGSQLQSRRNTIPQTQSLSHEAHKKNCAKQPKLLSDMTRAQPTEKIQLGPTTSFSSMSTTSASKPCLWPSS